MWSRSPMRTTPRHPDDEAIIDRFVDHIVRVEGLSVATVVRRRSHLRRFLHWCRRRHLDAHDIVVTDVRDFLDAELACGLSSSTVAGTHSTLRGFYDHLDPARRNPAREVPPARPEPPILRPYSPEEAEVILGRSAGERDVRERFDLAVVVTFAGAGVLQRELLALRTDDLDVDAGVLMVRGGRTQGRSVPLADGAVEVLAGYLAEVRPVCPPSDRLFANPRASFDSTAYGRLEPCVAGAIVRRLGRSSGVVGPHTCTRWRVTAAVDLLRAGVALEEVQRRLGHAKLATTRRYLPLLDALAPAEAGPGASTGRLARI